MNAVYARQSVDRPDSISIESQIEHCMYEVKKEEHRIYIDKGYSGKNTERPEFQVMMEHIKQGIIQRVIVYKLDRISRSILDFSKMMEIFQDYGVEFVSTTEKFDTSTPMGRAMLNICIVFAQLERETIQKRVTDAYTARSRAGLYMGGRIPYGFKREPLVLNNIHTSQYIPIAEESKQLQIIFDCYSKPAISISDVVRHLRQENIKKTRGIEWSAPRIAEILRNPIYVKADIDVYDFFIRRGTEVVNPPEDFIGENGCYLYAKNTQAIEKKKAMARYSNMILVLAPHKGIIESHIWLSCRLKAEQNAQIPTGRKSHRTWVSGKLKCGMCGYALRYNKWVGKSVENEYYLCSQVSGNRRCKGIGAVRKDIIEAEILKQIQTKVTEIEVEQRQPTQKQSKANVIGIAITNKEREIDLLLDRFKGGGDAIMRRLNKRVDEIEREISAYKQELFRLGACSGNKEQMDTGIISQIFSLWHKVPLEEKQVVADILIKQVLITKQTIEIVWRV